MLFSFITHTLYGNMNLSSIFWPGRAAADEPNENPPYRDHVLGVLASIPSFIPSFKFGSTTPEPPCLSRLLFGKMVIYV